MTASGSDPLSELELDRLLSSMQTGREKPARAPRAAPAKPRPSVGFETHPLYLNMKVQRDFAQLLQINDPYYRSHDVRAGATSVINGRPVANFASYDYLGLNGNPEIIAAVTEAAKTYGTSVSASRISAGERQVHRELEAALSKVYEADDTIAFVSGHAAAVNTLATLLGPKDLIVHDAVIHNCVVVGAQLAGCARRLYPHNDLDALEALLNDERDQFERVMIVTEGLFSMDGDGPDLARLIEMKNRYGAVLMVDDAHGLGVLGATGKGIFEHQGISPTEVDLWLGTLSKSLVSCGGYVSGNAVVIDLLKHQAPGFVYSVGMPAGAAVASTKALDIMAREPDRVQRLQTQSQRFFHRAKAAGLNVADAWGYGIVPIIIGDTIKTLYLAERLLSRGINAFPILPPGVPEKSARLRFFINQTHSDEQIDEAVDATAAELAGLGGARPF
jgi:8-amino-7-oxononanoate synthase